MKLKNASKERVLCVVTDGMPDDTKGTIAAAKEVKRQGIDVMAIGIDDANHEFLALLVSRRELARKVQRHKLGEKIGKMAKLLPRSD